MESLNNREKGSQYEERAAEFLIGQGLMILEKNYRRKTGEIDLIALDGHYYVFVEVKFRLKVRKGFPEEAVNPAKQLRIYRTAEWYLKEHGLTFQTPCRFDVVSILGNDIRHIKNAFGGF